MGAENMEAANEYGADQIQILEGLEAVRKRPGMYIGSTSARGLHHLVYEIVDNAVDEALAGYCKNIYVSINENNSITVEDDGRGIPVDVNQKAGKSALEVVYETYFATAGCNCRLKKGLCSKPQSPFMFISDARSDRCIQRSCGRWRRCPTSPC